LATCKPGQALDEAEEEPQNEEETAVTQEPEEAAELKRTGYKIIGTLKNPASQKPDFVEDILNRHEIDQLTMDVSLEATILKEEYQIQWRSEAGMVENMSMLAEEYLNSRNLKNWSSGGVDTEDGGELVSLKRQLEAHQAIIDALRQTGQMSHDVGPDG
uniref:Lipoprotein n=1 Tax=Schistocephalus solidus TaxID=70667 RepID=A0A183SZI8_SCHSO